jgi:hypothetical protein
VVNLRAPGDEPSLFYPVRSYNFVNAATSDGRALRLTIFNRVEVSTLSGVSIASTASQQSASSVLIAIGGGCALILATPAVNSGDIFGRQVHAKKLAHKVGRRLTSHDFIDILAAAMVRRARKHFVWTSESGRRPPDRLQTKPIFD